jgi:hypothetical protein
LRRIIISSIIAIVLVMPWASLFGIMCGNDINVAYGGGTTVNSGTASTSDIVNEQIGFPVIKGAGYYLTSQYTAQVFYSIK